MAGLDDILTALAGSDKIIAQENPWTPFQAVPAGIAESLNDPRVAQQYGTGETMAAAALANLASGFLGGMGQDWAGEQKGLFRDAVLGTAAGRKPGETDLDPQLFSKAEDLGELFRIQRALEAADTSMKTNADIRKAIDTELIKQGKIRKSDGTPETLFDPMALDVEKAKRIKMGEMAAEQQFLKESGFGDIASVPGSLRDDVIKDKGSQAAKLKADQLITDQFDVARNQPSWQAFIPGTTASNEMEGVAGSLLTLIQQRLGREMNGPEQERFRSLLPDWNDSVGQINEKEKRFKSLVNSISGCQ